MADINIPSRAPQVTTARPAAAPSTAQPTEATAPGGTDQVTLSDAAQKAQADSQPKSEPAPEKKGFWRGLAEFFMAPTRLDVMYQVQQTGRNPADVDQMGVYHEPKGK